MEACAMLRRQVAGKLEKVDLAIPGGATVRRAPAIARRMRVELVAERAEHRPHAPEAQAADLAAVGQRPRRNQLTFALRVSPGHVPQAIEQAAAEIGAIAPYRPDAPSLRRGLLRPQFAPYL